MTDDDLIEPPSDTPCRTLTKNFIRKLVIQSVKPVSRVHLHRQGLLK